MALRSALFAQLYCICIILCFFFFFFNDTATTEIYTLSLHDALPISKNFNFTERYKLQFRAEFYNVFNHTMLDRKSTRLNSSHSSISYAVFCLKKKKKNKQITPTK